MTGIDLLIHRYLEDRNSLSERELGELIAALRAEPELASGLREQLVLDDLLAQKLTLDRRNFVAQVEQRIADIDRGHKELSQQTADLRSIAAAERTDTGLSGGWRFTRFVLALTGLIVVGLSIFAIRLVLPHPPAIAKVTAVDGDVRIEEPDGTSEPAEKDGSLESGQRIVVPRSASIALTYQDGTELRIKGDSTVTIGSEKPEAIKQVGILRGEVVANIKPQLTGSVRFTTPHAIAVAPMSLLRLVVADDSTLLDVSEGKVQFDRITDKRTISVAANESGMASGDLFQIRKMSWPDRRDGLSYLYSPLESVQKENKPLTVARNPDTRSLRTTPLELRGAVSLSDSRWCELNGGYLFSRDAGPDIIAASRNGSELTLEAVFSPASMEQTGPARIVSLANEGEDPDFALDQDGEDFIVCLKTDAKPAAATPPRVTISNVDTPVHLTMTYRNGELIAYRDGLEISRSQDLWGSLAPWQPGPSLTVGADASGERTWRGIMEALALYNRCLEPGEVARNARNYRLLAGRGM